MLRAGASAPTTPRRSTRIASFEPYGLSIALDGQSGSQEESKPGQLPTKVIRERCELSEAHESKTPSSRPRGRRNLEPEDSMALSPRQQQECYHQDQRGISSFSVSRPPTTCTGYCSERPSVVVTRCEPCSERHSRNRAARSPSKSQQWPTGCQRHNFSFNTEGIVCEGAEGPLASSDKRSADSDMEEAGQSKSSTAKTQLGQFDNQNDSPGKILAPGRFGPATPKILHKCPVEKPESELRRCDARPSNLSITNRPNLNARSAGVLGRSQEGVAAIGPVFGRPGEVPNRFLADLLSPQAFRSGPKGIYEHPELGLPSFEMVIEYLSKKGYSRTEAMLRIESANQDVESRPINARAEETGGVKYIRAFELMQRWIEENLDIYKPDLRRLLWPIFVYSFLNLASDFLPKDSRNLFNKFKTNFEKEHGNDVRALEPISLPDHVQENEIAKIYRGNKYRVTLSQVAFYNLVQFLESKEKDGGAVIVGVIQSYLNVITVERAADDQYTLARLINRARAVEDFPAEDEGIPGHNPGSANVDRTAGSTVLTRLRLGPMPMETDLMGDVRAELDEEDVKHPPAAGQDSLAQHFEQQIKREESEDAPARTELPLPPSVARDVAMEVQKVKEDRDRFKIEARTGGVGPGVSVTMFTFHNTYDSMNCLDFSDDDLLVAAGMSESYIRVWSLDGKALPSSVTPGSTEPPPPSPSRRLIGHSGPVYSVSFSPSIASSNPLAPATNSKHLLSSSADKSVRLWSLETWTCLVVYKGHDHPVWDVTWGPFGLYFLTGSLDRTCRLWRTDHIEDLRMFVGHDKDVDTVCFHPNSAYVFTGSSDKIVRMWAVANGYPVRMFTGHTGNVTTLACSPSGKLLASADDNGTIILWDLGPGKLKKRMRGHGKGGIWSLSWSVESTVLASGGADGTVRIWDVAISNDANGQVRVIGEGGSGQKIDGNAAQMQAVAGAGTKKKGKDVVVTSDQISAFPTKKSPVYKVKFTRQNLVVAGGAYLP